MQKGGGCHKSIRHLACSSYNDTMLNRENNTHTSELRRFV